MASIKSEYNFTQPSFGIKSSNTSRLWKSGNLADVTIKCCGSTFKAHSAILVSQSGFFARALNGSFREAKSRCIDVSNYDPIVIKAVLQFIYTCQYTLPDPPPVHYAILHAQVFAAGEFFTVKELKLVAADQFRLCMGMDPRGGFAAARTIYNDMPTMDALLRKTFLVQIDQYTKTIFESPNVQASENTNIEILNECTALQQELLHKLILRQTNQSGLTMHNYLLKCTECKQACHGLPGTFSSKRCPQCWTSMQEAQ